LDKVYFKLGMCEKSLGDLQKARESFEKGLKISPDNKEILNALNNIENDV